MKRTSQRLVLREINGNELNAIHEIHSCPEVDRFATLGIPKSEEDTKKYMNLYLRESTSPLRRYYAWAIIEKGDGQIIGLIGLHDSLDRFKSGELWYKLLPAYWGKGFATEAAKVVINFGFNTLNLHRIEAGVATKNVSSIRVLEKIGMIREGLKRKVLPIRGAW